VDEGVIPAIVGRDEAEALGVIEKFYGSLRHLLTFLVDEPTAGPPVG
jgi:hypothetical protein